jgi:DNA-binding SARP family transcriptional activator
MGENQERLTHATGWYLRLVGVVEVCAVDTANDSWEVRGAGSRKARTLLALLGARAGRAVVMDQVVDALWTGPSPRQPEANVATLVSRLRATFGRGIVAGGHGGYRLGDGIRVDLHEAATLVAAAEGCLVRGLSRHGLATAEHAIELLDRGPALGEYLAEDWAAAARSLQESLLRRARHAAAESALRADAPARAQVLAESAMAADPLDETAYRLFMRACVATGEPARAMVAFQRLRTTLAAELGADPARATRDLHVTILRHHGAKPERHRAPWPSAVVGQGQPDDQVGLVWGVVSRRPVRRAGGR